MRVYPDQLIRHLDKPKQCYLVFGNDPYLVDTAKQQILGFAKQQGFEERVQLEQETGFSWDELIQEWQSMSLFASRRIIELSLPQAKPGAEGSKVLQALMQSPNPDLILIVHGPKLAQEQTKSKWFKCLDSQGIYLPCATPEGQQFQRWLDARIQHFKLTIDTDAKALLNSLYEGNLLAADQALQLLCLLNPSSSINSQQLSQYFEDQSRFSVFQLTDALLLNQQDKAMHILRQLQAEGTAVAILFWSLLKEISLLFELKVATAQGDAQSNLWQKHRIWDKRKSLYQAALLRLEHNHIETMLAFASTLELKLKQQGIEDWIGISHLCLLFDPNAHSHLAHIEAE